MRVLLAAAVAVAPLGTALSVAHANSVAAPKSAQVHAHGHHHHGDGAIGMADTDAVTAASHTVSPCHGEHAKHKSDRGCCCDDESGCDASCLLMCSTAHTAVMPPQGSDRIVLLQRFALSPVERPPDWRSSPTPPPPRA